MTTEFTYESTDGTVIYVYKWAAKDPKAVVQIAHGAIEHAMRYDDFAKMLVKNGFSVYANDHRGHGKTAAGVDNIPYLSDQKGGFLMIVDDAHALTKLIKEENEGLPVFFFGHSMGSSVGRTYAARYGKHLDGLLLTGTGRVNPFLVSVVRTIAKAMMKLMGRKHKSSLLHTFIFGTLNRPFGGETGNEFISSDKAVVEAYVADEFCGNLTTTEFANELMWGTRQAAKKETFDGTPTDLPIFIGAGEHDSMGGKDLAAIKADVSDYEKRGVADLTFKIYDGMRHEILNETEKQTVYDDIIGWLKARI